MNDGISTVAKRTDRHLNRSRLRIVHAMAVPCLVLVLMAGCSSPQAGDETERAVPVVIGQARTAVLPNELRLPGVVEAERTVELRPQVEGLVTRVYVGDGARVQRGDPVFEIDPRPAGIELARAQSELSMERAESRRLEVEAKRCERLAAERFLSDEDLQRCRSQLQIAIAKVQRAEADVSAAQLTLERTVIRSPIEGRLGRLRTRVGDRVEIEESTPLAIVRRIAPAHVAFSVADRDFAKMRVALETADLALSIEARGLRSPVTARFAYAENAFDPDNGAVRVRAATDNDDEALWPGAFVEVVVAHGPKSMVVVPESAVKVGPDGDYVYVVDRSSRAALRKVVVDRRAKGLAGIASGLQSNERVVLDGHSRLSDGVRIRVADRPS